MYTALQTWAFSLKYIRLLEQYYCMTSLYFRPGNNPTSPDSNCNPHQRIALIIVLSLSASLAFLSCFVKRFVYDSGNHVSFPAPDFFNVAQEFTDPGTKREFPYIDKNDPEKKVSWPLVDDSGQLTYNGTLLAVLVFKPGVKIYVKRKMWLKRKWDWFKHVSQNLSSLYCLFWPTFYQHKQSKDTPDTNGGTATDVEKINVTTVVKVATTASTLEPRWKHTVVGSSSSKAYLDLSASVWPHAIVSVIAFFTLALFSTQVNNSAPKHRRVRNTLCWQISY